MKGLKIIGMGRALPSSCVTNEDFAQRMDTSDEWIATRTGIRQRYFCQPEESCGTLAAQAARHALEAAGLTIDQMGLIVAATFTADYRTPSVACQVHEALGATRAMPCFDLNAACSGFVYGLETARSLLAGGNAGEYALVIGAECLSRVVDMEDRSTCVLFGDGAGAAVVQLAQLPYACVWGAQGQTEPLHAASLLPERTPYLQMDGKAIFRFAVDILPKCLEQLSQASGIPLEQMDQVVCHQANSRIIDHVAKKLGAPQHQFYKNMHRYGNTSAASIPLALSELWAQGRLAPGTTAACVGFGAGLTWGACLLTF